jgi:hypothetical protein
MQITNNKTLKQELGMSPKIKKNTKYKTKNKFLPKGADYLAAAA